MSKFRELRVFMNADDLMTDFYRFEKTEADTASYKHLLATSGSTVVEWATTKECEPCTCRFAGREFNRIKMDVRCGERAMMYMMTRLRSPDGPVEPMQVFYKRPQS